MSEIKESKNNRYSIFFKNNKSADWLHEFYGVTEEECENYCKDKGFAEYKIMLIDNNNFDNDLHLKTNIVHFEDKYYFADDTIPYPSTKAELTHFEIAYWWDSENRKTERYEDLLNNIEKMLWTCITTKFILPDKELREFIIAQLFVEPFEQFLNKLDKTGQSVYINEEYSQFKWLAWVDNENIRLIHQDYSSAMVETKFDIMIEKRFFFHLGKCFIRDMQIYIKQDEKAYMEYKNNN